MPKKFHPRLLDPSSFVWIAAQGLLKSSLVQRRTQVSEKVMKFFESPVVGARSGQMRNLTHLGLDIKCNDDPRLLITANVTFLSCT